MLPSFILLKHSNYVTMYSEYFRIIQNILILIVFPSLTTRSDATELQIPKSLVKAICHQYGEYAAVMNLQTPLKDKTKYNGFVETSTNCEFISCHKSGFQNCESIIETSECSGKPIKEKKPSPTIPLDNSPSLPLNSHGTQLTIAKSLVKAMCQQAKEFSSSHSVQMALRHKTKFTTDTSGSSDCHAYVSCLKSGTQSCNSITETTECTESGKIQTTTTFQEDHPKAKPQTGTYTFDNIPTKDYKFVSRAAPTASCYLISKRNGNITVANKECTKIGWDLVAIETAEEFTFLLNHLHTHEPDVEDFWTSGSDSGEEGVWRWLSTCTLVRQVTDSVPNKANYDDTDCLAISAAPSVTYQGLYPERCSKKSLYWVCENQDKYCDSSARQLQADANDSTDKTGRGLLAQPQTRKTPDNYNPLCFTVSKAPERGNQTVGELQCRLKGFGHLAAVENHDEFYYIANFLQNQPPATGNAQQNQRYWLSGTNQIDHGGGFWWKSVCTPVIDELSITSCSYSPSDSFRCIAFLINGANTGIIRTHCSDLLPFLCKQKSAECSFVQ